MKYTTSNIKDFVLALGDSCTFTIVNKSRKRIVCEVAEIYYVDQGSDDVDIHTLVLTGLRSVKSLNRAAREFKTSISQVIDELAQASISQARLDKMREDGTECEIPF